eukprot:m.159948 g.159948  ORF g.159948 m.159948 type:complete len:74 (-) comp18010_c0_seq1:1217-1438(-)
MGEDSCSLLLSPPASLRRGILMHDMSADKPIAYALDLQVVVYLSLELYHMSVCVLTNVLMWMHRVTSVHVKKH